MRSVAWKPQVGEEEMTLEEPFRDRPKDIFDEDPRIIRLTPGEIKEIIPNRQTISNFTLRTAYFYVRFISGRVDVALVRKDDMEGKP